MENTLKKYQNKIYTKSVVDSIKDKKFVHDLKNKVNNLFEISEIDTMKTRLQDNLETLSLLDYQKDPKVLYEKTRIIKKFENKYKDSDYYFERDNKVGGKPLTIKEIYKLASGYEF